jgi:Flp pilus assembly protein TadD
MRGTVTGLALVLLFDLSAALAQTTGEQTRREALRHYRDGQQAMFAEAWDRAEREFRTAIELEPLLTVAHYGLGQVYMQTKRYPEAITAFQGCLGAEQRVAGMIGSERTAVDRMRQEEVRELRDSIRLLQSGTVKVSDAPHQIMRIEQRISELERTTRRERDGFDPPPEVSLALGSAYYRTGAVGDAERHYLEAIRVRPTFGEAHNNLAVIYMQTNRLDEAKASLKRAEKAGYRVNPQFKKDLDEAMKKR